MTPSGRTELVALLFVVVAASGAVPALASAADGKPYCTWSGFVSIPYVPNANIELIEGLLPQTCSDKLLTPELKRNCRSCERRATRGECLRGIAQTWNNGAGAGKHPSMSISCVLCPAADRQSCNWLSWNARGEKVREVNYTLGINWPYMLASKINPRACSQTREYTVLSSPAAYSTAYFTLSASGADPDHSNGAEIPGGLRPDISCLVRSPNNTCSIVFHNTPDVHFTLSSRDMWTKNKDIVRRLSVNDDDCLYDPRRHCQPADPPFKYLAKITEHLCPPGVNPSKVVRYAGKVPMGQPGYLLYPSLTPLNYRETGFSLKGLSRVEWNINSQSQMLVMIAPADVALYVCPPGTKVCDYRRVWNVSKNRTKCFFSRCTGVYKKLKREDTIMMISYLVYDNFEQYDPDLPSQTVDVDLYGYPVCGALVAADGQGLGVGSGSGGGSSSASAAAYAEGHVLPLRYVGRHHAEPLPPPPGSSVVAAAAAGNVVPDDAVVLFSIPDGGASVEETIAQLQQHPDIDIAEPNFIRRRSNVEDGLGTGGGGGTDDGMCSAAANDMGGGGGGGGDGAASSHSAAARRLAAAAQPASGPPNDFFYSGRHTLWHLSQVQAPVAWHASTGSNQVRVCVIDTGARGDHEDLQQGRLVKGWNRACPTCAEGRWTGDMPAPGTPAYFNFSDHSGHGTHTSGIIGALANNLLGVAGVAWNVSIYMCAVEGPDMLFYTASLLDCYALCQQEGARIVSNSYGSDGPEGAPGYSQLEYEAIQALGQAGALFVAAAGNGANNNDEVAVGRRFYPASYQLDTIISVAATKADDTLTSYSTYGRYGGSTVHLAAPGTVLSTFFDSPSSYKYLSGTSMSCPLVAGAVALLLALKPSAGPLEIKQALLSSVDPVAALAGRVSTGGRLNVAAAVAALLGIPDPPPRIAFGDMVEPHTTAAFSFLTQSLWRLTDQHGTDAEACRASCLSTSWCFLWLAAPSLSAMWAQRSGITYRGSCFLGDGTVVLTDLNSNAPNFTAGYRTVGVPGPWLPAPPAPPRPPPRPPLPPRRPPSPRPPR
ncbi:hypothetical protein CHLNCDRAFT_55404 [Chlorella variabilis]|uniref:Peptidase S8/S53 domain-containing protein n=1 Tax=Chlorella variabilis TaxID=554065 RepID=E1ZT27_CHLVA|nr:hypothetical protein CHLNCDRAFT_55404 [Chlorella variabilis]EFN51040.1 hypothetical protein CHLNCDRAFT_55404 [Chlorella variabilis]|eukprot:XP_005843142.1 hypothetical protein CHLNCDRAFT_55404 [Chlorella variabilis]